MKKNKAIKIEAILPDLKHDSLEYSAATDGDDQLDIIEEDEITANELAALEQKNILEEAYSLNAAIVDSKADEDNYIIDSSDKDEFEEDKTDNFKI